LTTVSEDDSRVKWLCHRYVEFAAEFRVALDELQDVTFGVTTDT